MLKAKGKFLIVDVESCNEVKVGKFQVILDQVGFAKGKVIASGPYVIVDVGAEVIVSLDGARQLGLAYPPSYMVVNAEDGLVAVLEPEEEEAGEDDEDPCLPDSR